MRAVTTSIATRPHAAWLLAFALAGCAGLSEKNFATYYAAADRPPTHHGLPLANGQIVVSESGGALSLLFMLSESDFVPYVHAGVLAYERDEFYVYHAVGTMKPSFGGAPTDAVRGGVRRDPLDHYLRRYRIVAIYDPPPAADPARVAVYAQDAYARGVPFDAHFDPHDAGKLYCTELVAAALEAAGAEPIPRRPRRAHASLAAVFDWLKMRATELISPRDLMHPERLAALVSRDYSPREIEIHQATRAELHRRFTDDQRLGHVFEWRGTQLRLRASVVEFERAARALYGVPTNDSAPTEHVISVLAGRMLGELPMHRPVASPRRQPSFNLQLSTGEIP